MSLQAAAQRSLALWEGQQPFEGGLAFEALLRRCRLDYSPASLGRIDAFLDALQRARRPREADFVADPAQHALLHLLAFYAGELLGRALGTPPLWLQPAQAAALAPAQPLPQPAWRAELCARFGRTEAGGDALFLPLDAIGERLFPSSGGTAAARGLRASAARWCPGMLNNAARAGQPLPPLPGRPWPPALGAGPDADISPDALCAQAVRLLQGEGVASDPAQARALLERAAAQGHAPSLNALGTLVAQGVGGPVDLRLAMTHYRAAAEQGLAAAQLNVARMHLKHDGVAPDLVQAEHWLRLAAAQGNAKARRLIEELEFDRPTDPATTGFGELADSVLGWLREHRAR